jgi:GntR family transcriptional repressor for pyruvate dehydrogenase complex
MARFLGEMEEGLADAARYNRADIGFHTAIAAATGNRLTVRLMDAIRDAMSRTFAVAFHLPGNPELSLEEHRGIALALTERDLGAARTEMRHHLERVERDTAGSGGGKGSRQIHNAREISPVARAAVAR